MGVRLDLVGPHVAGADSVVVDPLPVVPDSPLPPWPAPSSSQGAPVGAVGCSD